VPTGVASCNFVLPQVDHRVSYRINAKKKLDKGSFRYNSKIRCIGGEWIFVARATCSLVF
jgi:hypothetical protein